MDQPAATLTASGELAEIARKLCWWQSADEALAKPLRFAAQVMSLGTWDDVKRVEAVLGREAFRQVLAHPPPGVFDEASWHYWHNVFGIHPVPPLPQRQL